MGNLNIHTLGSLYQAFESAEALHFGAAFGIYYTPKHGSWLNIAETD